MRVLCLHGVGTNGRILDSQTVAFRSLLPGNWEWHFVDGISSIYDGPYSCYYIDPSPENIQNAMDLVHEVMDEEGPFDAVMAFSQGAALAASIILNHQLTHPFDPPLFRLAIFLCANLPFSWTPNHATTSPP
ncbi:uncharacterized protein AB675_2443 [Cyphellophora attinorum]|uniref:Serine hydrolase domain-containing protein n=1 Tax=Cyphellophora attinorum TaxID=1664694 RepID=A0A0N1P1U0_9EURO|nr:uncharacterized protein AB675_2443 [Phialophora attinorum]KPI45007.1 hypothetical protein AB675_2443 [Phialophora attinorum]